MGDIGDISGLIALFITFIWWLGVTPKKVANWIHQYKLTSRIWNIIIPTLFIGIALFIGIWRFLEEPIVVGGNKWMHGGFWILVSLYFITRTEERHIRHFVTILTRARGVSLEIIGTIILTISTPLLFIGLNIPLKSSLLYLAYSLGAAAIIAAILFFIVRRLKAKKSK